jgi:DNA polymerase V
MLMQISSKAMRQETLFDDVAARTKSTDAMKVMDEINRNWGRGTLRTASSGINKRWAMRSENRSPRYTTQWAELPVAR